MPHTARPARRTTRCCRVLLATILGAALAGVVPIGPGARPAAAFPGDTVNLEGRGFGHGRGLGQYGSLGYALAGWDHGRILAYFYGGTTVGNRPDSQIDVHLRINDVGGGRGSLDGQPLVLDAGQDFTIGSNAFTTAEAARVTRTPGGWSIERGPGCDGPWTPAQSGIDLAQQPTAVVADPDVGNDISKMVQVCAPGQRRHYRGTVRAVDVGGESRPVNRVAMEDYLRGVVPRESPASWADLGGGAGINQLRSQAVAARSYAYAEDRGFAKTCDTTSCQVYGGAGLNNVRSEDSRTDRAVADTVGEVRLLGGAVARTEFSSSTGGYSAGGTFPAVRDDGDATPSNPNRTWQAKVPVATVESRYPTIGQLFSIDVTKRNGLSGPDGYGGRVLEVAIRGSKGSVVLTGDQMRSAFGLKSDWFRVTDPVLATPAVAIAGSPAGDGYWLATRSGEVFGFGSGSFGSLAGTPLNKPIVGMAATPTGQGYWLVATDGGIFSFGDARFQGSTGAIRLNQPIVGMAPTRTGRGYWLVARDGGIFSFGDAAFKGSTGAITLNQPIVGMAPTTTSGGYWFVAADGGVFNFGDAPFLGSAGAQALGAPVVGMAATRTGGGYRLAEADGGTVGFGDAGG